MLKNHKNVRVSIYLIGVASQIASFFVTIFSPELAAAFGQTADVLATIALGTALTNISNDDNATG